MALVRRSGQDLLAALPLLRHRETSVSRTPHVRRRFVGTCTSCAWRTSRPMQRKVDMSELSNENTSEAEREHDAERRQIAEVQDKLDAEADGDGLAAEAGSGEEMGLAEG